VPDGSAEWAYPLPDCFEAAAVKACARWSILYEVPGWLVAGGDAPHRQPSHGLLKPGILRGIAELLGGHAAVRTILDWRRGRRKALVWAIDQLQGFLQDRVNRDTQVIAELDKEKPTRVNRSVVSAKEWQR
jgi:hypothetical protein